MKASSVAASASQSAAAASQTLSDSLLESWSDSRKHPIISSRTELTPICVEIKEWADKNGIKVPQGSKRNELLAIARKHRGSITGDNVVDSAKSAYGAATSNAGTQYAKATDAAAAKGEDLFNQAIGTWSEVSNSELAIPEI